MLVTICPGVHRWLCLSVVPCGLALCRSGLNGQDSIMPRGRGMEVSSDYNAVRSARSGDIYLTLALHLDLPRPWLGRCAVAPTRVVPLVWVCWPASEEWLFFRSVRFGNGTTLGVSIGLFPRWAW